MSIDSPVRGGEEKRSLHPFFDDEKCKKIALELCDDIDLKTISEKVAHTSLTTTQIGVHFGLDAAAIQTIEEDNECQEYSDKVHKFLVQWRDGRDERKESTVWVDLIQCLVSFSDEKLLADTKAYLHQKENLQTSLVGRERITVEVECVQESNKPSEVLPFSQSVSNTNSQDSLEAFAEVPSPVQHDEGGVIDMGALVTGKSPQKRFKRGTNPVNIFVKERMVKLDRKFAKLLGFAHEKLTALVSVDTLRVYITHLSVSQKENIPLFSKHMTEIISETSHSKIFALLSRMGAWSMLNFHLLHGIAEEYGDEELKAAVSHYSTDVNLFKQETTLEDFLCVWSSRSAYGSLPERQPLIAKLKVEWKDCTLATVAQEECYLANEFQLEPHIMHFSNGNPGCVVLMWLIPAAAVSLIQEAVKEKGSTLKKKILQLIVGDKTFVFKDTPVPTSLALPQPQNMKDVKGKSITDPLEQLMNADYTTTYEKSIQDPEKFWGELAGKCLVWEKQFEEVMDCDMKEGVIQWFIGGKLNVSVNCLDRHVETHPERTALIWEKDEPKQAEKVSYRELLDMTCRIANVLKKNKIKKGDTVVIYMPVAPLTVASMLACSRIGAIHSVIFTSVSADMLKKMITKAHAKAVITVNTLKANVDKAVVEVVFVASNSKGPLVSAPLQERDILLEEAMKEESTVCPPELMDSEDTLFIMYTSGTSDEPRGIVHTQAGYLLYAAVTHKHVFNYKPEEVFACVAGLCWITGHSYIVYGPLCNGGTTVLFDSTSRPSSPNSAADRYLEMISRLKVNHFYTSPATVRLLMKAEENRVNKHDLSSLKTIGSVGEPLSAAAWTWYNKLIGKEMCTVVDTWWQTEIGGIAIAPHPAPSGSRPKPGFPMKPFFGVDPVIVDDKGQILEGPDVTGFLCLKKPLPGMGRCINGDPQKYKEDYFQRFPGLYFTNDIAYRDADGDYKIIGRESDIPGPINGDWIALHVPDIENVVNMSDPRVLESSVVPYKEKDSKTIEYKVFIQFTEKEVTKTEKRRMIGAIEKALIHSSYVVSGSRRQYIVVKKQPKTHSDKINRHVLKDMASTVEGWQLQQSQGSTASEDAIYDERLNTIDIECLCVSSCANLGY